MSKHTPGPWIVEEVSGNSTHAIRKHGLSDDSRIAGYIAFINTHWPSPEQSAEMLFNVHLIAAAPALLEACMAVLSHVEDMDIERMPPSMCTLCYTHRKILRDAIQKAEGRE